MNNFLHGSSKFLALLLPASLVLSSTPVSLPVDTFLGIVMPLHAHVGLNHVVTDYVPKAMRSLARAGVLGMTVVTVLGLLKLNLDGPGLSHSVLSLWCGNSKEKK